MDKIKSGNFGATQQCLENLKFLKCTSNNNDNTDILQYSLQFKFDPVTGRSIRIETAVSAHYKFILELVYLHSQNAGLSLSLDNVQNVSKNDDSSFSYPVHLK